MRATLSGYFRGLCSVTENPDGGWRLQILLRLFLPGSCLRAHPKAAVLGATSLARWCGVRPPVPPATQSTDVGWPKGRHAQDAQR